MSGRGKPIVWRPITPLDPSLSTRPVPCERTFTGRSFGPGAAPAIQETARSLKELDQEAPWESFYPEKYRHYGDPMRDNPVRDLLKEVESLQVIRSDDGKVVFERDPTWGFYVFVTDYSPETTGNIPKAMETLMSFVQRNLEDWTCVPHAEEAFRRFRLDLIEDQTALEGASYDRIRAEFQAIVQAKIQKLKASHNWGEEDELILWPRARYVGCLVLNAQTASTLANVPQFDDPKERDEFLTAKVVFKVVDLFWQRPPPGTLVYEKYRGVVNCSIERLPLLYEQVTSSHGTHGVAEFDEHQRLGLYGVVRDPLE